MTREELLSHISINPEVCFGKPCIRGHRIWVSLILDLLAGGATFQEILANYPGLTREDSLACIAYGAEMAREGYVEIPPERPMKLKLDENHGRRVAELTRRQVMMFRLSLSKGCARQTTEC